MTSSLLLRIPSRALRVGAALHLLGLGFALQLLVALPAQAQGQTTKPDEKEVTRVVRVTPAGISFQETHFCLLPAFNQTNDKIVLWGPQGPAWGRVDALTSWQTPQQFSAVLKVLPQWGGRPPSPIWSELPGEANVLYSLSLDTSEVMRIDVASGTSSVVVKLPGSPRFAENFFLPGFSSDGKLVIWEAPDEPSSRGWMVDPIARTVQSIPSQPAEWSADWSRYPYNSHGHSARSPDRTLVIGPSAPDLHGYSSYLMKKGSPSLGLGWRPWVNHVAWQASNRWAIVDDGDTGSLYQVWTDGTWAKLLDLRLSKVPLASGGYYRDSSFANVSRDGRMILYSSDGGSPTAPIGIFIAFLGDANPATDVSIQRFDADPAVIAAGSGSSLLQWSTKNATSVRITPGPGGLAASGSLLVQPTADTVYELVAEGPAGPVSRRRTVRAVAQPAASLLANGSMELGSVGQIPQGWRSNGPAVLEKDRTHDFTSSVRVTSDQHSGQQGKVWAYASGDDARRAQGHRVTLTAWLRSAETHGVHPDSLQIQYGNPTRSQIVPIDDVIGADWKEVSTSFVLPSDVNGVLGGVVSAAGGWESSSVYVDQVSLAIDDSPAPPVIDAFTAAAPFSSGAPLSVSWQVHGATSLTLMPAGVRLTPLASGVFVFGGDYPVPASGVTVTLVAAGPGGSTTKALAFPAGLTAPAQTLAPPSAPDLAP